MDDQRKFFAIADYVRENGDTHPSMWTGWNRVRDKGKKLGRFRRLPNGWHFEQSQRPRESRTKALVQVP